MAALSPDAQAGQKRADLTVLHLPSGAGVLPLPLAASHVSMGTGLRPRLMIGTVRWAYTGGLGAGD